MTPDFQYRPPNDPVVVIYRDDELLLIDKPAGLLSVPGKAVENRDCLETRVKADFPNALLVHRLDMDTSGLMIFAMTRPAQRHLGLQFERRHVEKTYRAEVWGDVRPDDGEVDLPLIVDWPNRPLQKICTETGKSAQTRWSVMGRRSGATTLKLMPKTGRSHQLRVHMLAIGHPILGDRFYATGAALAASDRLMLHAESLAIYHPNGGKRVKFIANCPF
jgi:tRNA pseudouridine32 synthase/23S rRNA pseudouridine746 synthase